MLNYQATGITFERGCDIFCFRIWKKSKIKKNLFKWGGCKIEDNFKFFLVVFISKRSFWLFLVLIAKAKWKEKKTDVLQGFWMERGGGGSWKNFSSFGIKWPNAQSHGTGTNSSSFHIFLFLFPNQKYKAVPQTLDAVPFRKTPLTHDKFT